MKTPIVFSLFREQSIFMTAIMSLLTFLAVLSLGIGLAIGTGVMRWNAQWDTIATIQVVNPDNAVAVKKIIYDNQNKIKNITEITPQQMENLLRPWISSDGNALQAYLPQMYEVKFYTRNEMSAFGSAVSNYARFLTHYQALRPSIAAGWHMAMIAILVLILVIGTIGVCISYIARNTAQLHKHELEILNQVGATDAYIAKQMQMIVARICIAASASGFIAAFPVLLLIIGVATSARIGLMSMIGLTGFGWACLILMPIAIVMFAICITRRTTFKILQNK